MCVAKEASRATFSSSPFFCVAYGSSVTTIASRAAPPPRESVSMWARARIMIEPRPVV